MDQSPASSRGIAGVVDAFLDAFNNHSVEDILSLMSDDAVFETLGPAPDGGRVVGREALRKTWAAFFEARPMAKFHAEDTIVAGDRAISQWNLTWVDGGKPQNIRGVDILTIRGGKIVDKRVYTKR